VKGYTNLFVVARAPVLAVLYWRLAKKEDEEIEEQFGEEFREYKRKVPGFIPRLRIKKLEKSNQF
jgi:protein-S-isoprenylcysteine O-methyltransferase Ste14